jgi:hypothetical protein
MTMLPKTRRLRYGALALTIAAFVPLAIGGSASASTIQGPGNFSYGPQGNEQLVNHVNASAVTNHKTVFKVKFGLGVGASPVVTAVNRAVALTSRCEKCNAIAIGFQVVTTTTQDLLALHAVNVASATNDSCRVTCAAVADAYQVVVATDTPQAMSFGQLLSPQQLIALYYLRSDFLALPDSGLSLTQIQDKCEDLVGQAIAILQDANYGGPNYGPPVYTTLALPSFSPAAPSFSPAVSGAGAGPDVTSSNQPVVKLYQDIQSLPSSAG